MFAAVVALGARERRIPRPVAVLVVGLPAGVFGALGLLTVTSDLYAFAAVTGLPFAVAVLAVAALPVAGRSRWTALGVGALILAGPVMFVQLEISLLFGVSLMRAAGYDMSVDGLPYLVGTVVVGVPLAVLAAVRGGVRPVPAPLPVPVAESA